MVLKTLQHENEATMIQLDSGMPPPKRKKKYAIIDDKLSVYKDELRKRTRSPLAFADAVSYLLYDGSRH